MQSGYNYSMLDCFGGIECVNAQYKNVHLAKHVHEGYAIGVINQGVQKFNSLGCNHSAGTGSLVIVNADTVHTGESIRDVGCNYRALYPTPESIDTILSDLPSSKSCAPYFTNPILHDTELIELLKTIFSHSDNQSPKLVMESLLFTFFAKLVVRQSHSRLSLNTANASSNIDKVRDYLNEYAQQNISLDELARIGNVNKYTLIRQFKQKWGLAPHQYQIQIRVQKAKRLLRTGLLPVEVATECGFYDQSHLCRHFKKSLGATPNQYQVHTSFKTIN